MAFSRSLLLRKAVAGYAVSQCLSSDSRRVYGLVWPALAARNGLARPPASRRRIVTTNLQRNLTLGDRQRGEPDAETMFVAVLRRNDTIRWRGDPPGLRAAALQCCLSPGRWRPLAWADIVPALRA